MGIISMKKNNIGYLLREGFKGVFLHGFMSFAAIGVSDYHGHVQPHPL